MHTCLCAFQKGKYNLYWDSDICFNLFLQVRLSDPWPVAFDIPSVRSEHIQAQTRTIAQTAPCQHSLMLKGTSVYTPVHVGSLRIVPNTYLHSTSQIQSVYFQIFSILSSVYSNPCTSFQLHCYQQVHTVTGPYLGTQCH